MSLPAQFPGPRYEWPGCLGPDAVWTECEIAYVFTVETI